MCSRSLPHCTLTRRPHTENGDSRGVSRSCAPGISAAPAVRASSAQQPRCFEVHRHGYYAPRPIATHRPFARSPARAPSSPARPAVSAWASPAHWLPPAPTSCSTASATPRRSRRLRDELERRVRRHRGATARRHEPAGADRGHGRPRPRPSSARSTSWSTMPASSTSRRSRTSRRPSGTRSWRSTCRPPSTPCARRSRA